MLDWVLNYKTVAAAKKAVSTTLDRLQVDPSLSTVINESILSKLGNFSHFCNTVTRYIQGAQEKLFTATMNNFHYV